MRVDHSGTPSLVESSWRQVLIGFHDYAAAENIGVAHIGPQMADAEAAGEITSWFFIRKNPCWRLRFHPADAEPDPARLVHQRLTTLRDTGRIADWVESIYEPETHAFGGPAAMETAHRLFHHDSRALLNHLADHQDSTPGRGDQRRELSILLCTRLLRAAGQDWYEQGDIWARVADHKPLPPDTPPERLQTMASHLRRLMTTDLGPLTREDKPLAFLADWATAFHHTGASLGELARDGTLTRGLRAVLAHHVIFHWNRIGLPAPTQGLLAHAAKSAVFDR